MRSYGYMGISKFFVEDMVGGRLMIEGCLYYIIVYYYKKVLELYLL